MSILNYFSDSGVSKGVKQKVETTSVVRRRWRAKIPFEDPPNQEKKQYWTVYWWGKGAFHTKSKEGSDQIKKWRISENGLTKNIGKVKVREWKCSSLFRMTFITWKERETNGSLFEKTLSFKIKKVSYCEKRVFEEILQYYCLKKF